MIVESWIDSMEKLFEDFLMPERVRVMLAVPFLDKMAHRWWKAEFTRQADAATQRLYLTRPHSVTFPFFFFFFLILNLSEVSRPMGLCPRSHAHN